MLILSSPNKCPYTIKMCHILTKLTYFGPEHFPPTQDSETLHGFSFGQYKMVPEKRKSYFLSQDSLSQNRKS